MAALLEGIYDLKIRLVEKRTRRSDYWYLNGEVLTTNNPLSPVGSTGELSMARSYYRQLCACTCQSGREFDEMYDEMKLTQEEVAAVKAFLHHLSGKDKPVGPMVDSGGGCDYYELDADKVDPVVEILQKRLS